MKHNQRVLYTNSALNQEVRDRTTIASTQVSWDLGPVDQVGLGGKCFSKLVLYMSASGVTQRVLLTSFNIKTITENQ